MSAIDNIFKNYPNKYFIETGTGFGFGVDMAMYAGFPVIYSIELSLELYEKAVRKYKDITNVLIFWGDSTDVLGRLIEHINEPITFWLDAHYCGAMLGNVVMSAHNNKVNTPVLEELIAIKQHSIKTHTILIDDMGTFGGLPLEQLIYDINPDYKISYTDGNYKNDILTAVI